MSLDVDKKALRQQVRRSRAGRSAAERQHVEMSVAAAALELPAVRKCACVAVYASLPDEPGTGELRRRLRAQGVRVLLPVVLDGTTRPTLDWAPDTGDLAPAGALRLPEPTAERLGTEAVAQAGILLVPAMAVDRTGLRLGRGRGYYDATLARLGRTVPVIAIVHDDELVTEVPAEPHDQRVDGALTPSRTIFFSPRA